MTTVITEQLPARMKHWGCTLEKTDNGKTSKYVLKSDKFKYRGFTYIHNNRYDRDGSGLSDLFANFFYETGLQKVAHT